MLRAVAAAAMVLTMSALATPATAQVQLQCGPANSQNPVQNTANVLCAAPSVCDATKVVVKYDFDITGGGCKFDLGGRTLQLEQTINSRGTGFIDFFNVGNVTI